MSRRDLQELSRRYEGARVLGELLAAAGCEVPIDAIKELFQAAHQDGAPASEVIPRLFLTEPRFPTPEDARRTYGNLFGLWDRVGRGQLGEPQGNELASAPEPIAPPGIIATPVIPDAFVEAALGALTTLPERERRKLRDRFEQRENDLIEAVRFLGVSPGAEEAALELAFELWLLAQWALGERAGRVDFAKLRAPAPKGSQPALDRFIAEWLGEAELDDEEPLPPAERARLEPLLRQAAEQLAPV